MATHDDHREEMPSSGLRAEVGSGSPHGSEMNCPFCRRVMDVEYYDVNGTAVCPECEPDVREVLLGASGAPLRVTRALIAGVLAGVVGSAVFGWVSTDLRGWLAGFEVGIASLFSGWIVGRGVRWGARKRGGLPYQILASAITYLAVTQWLVYLNVKESHGWSDVASLVLQGLQRPFEGTWDVYHILRLLIIGFGVYEAWTLNRKAEIRVTGPIRVTT